MLNQIVNRFNQLRKSKPLIHHITNQVTINDCANITLAMGALPVMAHAREEVEEMVTMAGALVLNIGTLTPDQIEAMILAGQQANAKNIPVILDPVGVGATRLRTDSARAILHAVKVTVIKGNSAEIAILAGLQGEIKGVEAVGVTGDLAEGATRLANTYQTTVVVTGPRDLITNGQIWAYVDNGHPLMGTITGTGCMAASVIATFAAVERDPVLASLGALVCFGIAGELAAQRPETTGPASFKAAFFDSLYNLDEQTIRRMGRFTIENCQGGL